MLEKQRKSAPGAPKLGICYARIMMFRTRKLARWTIFAAALVALALSADSLLEAQQPAKAEKQGVAGGAATGGTTNAEFAAAADEVLLQMSEITGLKLLTPLKKSLRSRDQIRAYVINEMKEDKDQAERYAGQRSAEAFGLLPKGFDLDNFMIDLLTEQIAGLYDPKTHEFYVADWIPASDQKMVMAHELTHALQDQHFKIDNWVKAARPNDDAELARESVLEGSAMAAMVDYLLAGTGRSLQDLPDIDPSMLVGDMESTPMLKKAPPFLRDALVFPYLDGLNFSAAVVRPKGWDALSGVFAKPPISTQQIMHPAMYFSFRIPPKADLPSLDKDLGSDWVRLEDNLMGEFGWKEVLKQFVGEERATPLAAAWSSDRYILFEQKKTKKLVLVARLDLADERATSRFFTTYSDALAKKYDKRTSEKKQDDFLTFDTPDGGVFFKCLQMSCVSLEGADRTLFDKLNSGLHWDTATPTKATDRTTVRRQNSGALAPVAASGRN
jgi:hypothetical protein